MFDIYERYISLLATYRRHIAHFCVSHCDNRADAEDLAQDIYAALWRSIATLQPDSTPRQQNRWLFRLMRGVYARRLRKKLPFLHADIDKVAGLVQPVDNNREIINDLAADLSDDERLLLARHLDGYSAEELAAEFGVTSAVIRKRMQRIKEKIIIKRKEIYG